MPALTKAKKTKPTAKKRQKTKGRQQTSRTDNRFVALLGGLAAWIVSILHLLYVAFAGGIRTIVRTVFASLRAVVLWTVAASRRRPLVASVLFSLGLLSGAVTWLNHTGALQQGWTQGRLLADIAMRHAGFTVENIYVNGRRETGRADIHAALGVEQGASMFTLDLQDARKRLQALPWVKEARVGRRWPDRVDIALVERMPLALWQLDQRIMLIDSHGERIDVPRADLHRFTHLPHIVGPDAPTGAAPILSLLKRQQDLFARVDALVRVGGRRWDIRLKEGILVRLPEQEPEHAWQVLAGMGDEPTLFTDNVKVIDMREKGKMVVRSRIGSDGMPMTPDREKRI